MLFALIFTGIVFCILHLISSYVSPLLKRQKPAVPVLPADTCFEDSDLESSDED